MSSLMMKKYRNVFFSYLYRDDEFPAVIKSKGFTFKGCIKVIFTSIIKELKDCIVGNNILLQGKIWIYVDSINQYRSLEFLKDISNIVFVSSSKKLIQLIVDTDILYLSNPYKLQERLKISRWGIFKNLFREKFSSHLITILKYDGILESYSKLLKFQNPLAIIMSNDHNLINRALVLASKDYEIKTVYLQHAAVTDRFPALLFDFNLLEGKDSLLKYQRAGNITGVVELVGMPKFDDYFRLINRRSRINLIGIALNNGDDFLSHFALLSIIKAEFNDIEVVLRFHPSINIDALDLPKNVLLSKPTEESSFSFLSKIDVLIAGDSSIHLEATLLNVVSIYIDFEDKNIIDYYGFLRNGLVDKVAESCLITWLRAIEKNKPQVRGRAKFYIDSVDTEWDGKSGEKVRTIISNIQENKKANI